MEDFSRKGIFGQNILEFLLKEEKISEKIVKVSCFREEGVFLETTLSQGYLGPLCSLGWEIILELVVIESRQEKDDLLDFLKKLDSKKAFSLGRSSVEGNNSALVLVLERRYKKVLLALVKNGAYQAVFYFLELLARNKKQFFLLDHEDPYSPSTFESPLLEFVLEAMDHEKENLRILLKKECGQNFFGFTSDFFSEENLFSEENFYEIQSSSLDEEVKESFLRYITLGFARNFSLRFLGEFVKERLKAKKLSREFVLHLLYYLNREDRFFKELKTYDFYRYFLLLREEETLLELSIQYRASFLFGALMFFGGLGAFEQDKNKLNLFDHLLIHKRRPQFLLRVFCDLSCEDSGVFWAQDFLSQTENLKELLLNHISEGSASRFRFLLSQLSVKYKFSFPLILGL